MARDKQYRYTSIGVNSLQQYNAVYSFNLAFENIDFQTRKEYQQAIDIRKQSSNILADITVVRGQYSTTGTTALGRSTTIQQSAKTVFERQTDIWPQYEDVMSSEQKKQFIEGLQLVDRVSTNVVGERATIPDYTEDTGRFTLQRGISAYEQIYQLPHENNLNKLIQKDKDRGVSRINQLISNIVSKYKPAKFTLSKSLIIAEKIYQYQPVIDSIGNNLTKVLREQQRGLENCAQQLFDWGDITKNPLGVLVNIMGGLGLTNKGLTQLFTSYESVLGDIIGGSIDIGQKLAKSMYGKKNRAEQTDTAQDVGIKIFGELSGMLVNLVSGITNIIMSLVNTQIQAFTSSIKSLLTLLKTIQNTSQMFKQIFEYINLAFTMLFLPFFTVIGEPILNQVMNLTTALMEYGIKFATSQQQAILLSDMNNLNWKQIFENIQDILKKFIEEFVPQSLSLIQPLIDFITEFIKTFIDNIKVINEMLTYGIDAYTQLMYASYMEMILDCSKVVFDWAIQNRDLLQQIQVVLLQTVRQGMDVLLFTMNNLEATLIALFSIVGQVTGALIQWRIVQIAQAFTLGLQLLSTPLVIGQGQAIGQTVGLVSQGLIINKFIQPVRVQVEKTDIPQFQEGGKVRHRQGGVLGLMSEQGHGEFAIPQSKLKYFRGESNVILRFNGKIYNQQQIDKSLDELRLESNIHTSN